MCPRDGRRRDRVASHAADPPTTGHIAIGDDVIFEGERVLTHDRQLRRKRMGIIFQAYNVIPFLTSVENVALVLTLNGTSRREAMTRANELLRRLDLGHRAETYPATLSGGEQRRVAVARAVVKKRS